MNLLQNRTMHPPLREEEALVIENAIRLAIDSIINVLYSVNGARTREYERMLGVRDKEIRRLSGREKDFERELQLLRRQGCSCGLYDAAAAAAADDHCGSSGFPDPLLQNPDCGDPGGDPGPGCGDPRARFDDPRPGCEDAADEMAAAHGQCELSFSLGLFDASPSQVSAQSQDLAAPPPPPPAVRSSFQQPPVHPAPQALAPLEERPAPPNGPVIKEEPSDMDAICESGDLHGMLGHAELGAAFRGGLYPSPEPLGLGGSEQHMMRRRNQPHTTETTDSRRERRRTGGPPPHTVGGGTELAEDMTPAVLAALPSLPEKKLQALLKRLSVMGVETEGDLQLVRELDLQDVLSPLQRRRLLHAWRGDDEHVSLGAVHPAASAEHRTPSPPPTPPRPPATAPGPPGGHSPNGSTLHLGSWPDNFVVPWARMPACVTAAVALHARPTPKSRREMVRIVVDEMRLTDMNPTRASCVAVAKQIVREHPSSFADAPRDGPRGGGGGGGYGSLVTQIKTRVEHVNRGNALARHRKPKRPSAEEGARWPSDH